MKWSFAEAFLRTAAANLLLRLSSLRAETLVFDQPECAGLSGFRAHWDRPIPVAEDGLRVGVDKVVTNRGQTAIWGGDKPGPLCFDAVHRALLVRFPGAAEKIAAALAEGRRIEKVELRLPYLDEEIWPPGRVDYPVPDGYRYRMNWGVDQKWRERRPNWHAMAYALRKPWMADPVRGPTYNAAINGALYWKRFGALSPEEDRFPVPFGPTELSSMNPEGRMDVSAVLAEEAFGKTLADRLRVFSDYGFLLQKWEVYDARFLDGSDAYEWASSSGPRAILIWRPSLVVTLAAGLPQTVGAVAPLDVAALADQYRERPQGAPTAVVPSPERVQALNAALLARPAWMPEWQYAHVRQLMGLKSGGAVRPFFYWALPSHVVNRAIEEGQRAARAAGATSDPDYAVYLTWLDYWNGEPPRFWSGHLTAQQTITTWYQFREALPEPVQESIRRSWTAWLMPDRETAPTDRQRRDFTDTSGLLVHPMADDPRVGLAPDGTRAEWGQGYTYYKKTGDWRGNKSFYRSGFTRMMSTANFNSSATSGALLCGQIIGAERAIADGRAGLWHFPFWMWTHNAGVGQEYIDHYYWAIATAGNKLLADFCERTEDRMAGWSILQKAVNDLALGYHPNLKKLIGPASRTYLEHALGEQDGLYHILHVISPKGALSDVETGTLPALSANPQRPISAWGHDFPPEAVALQSLSGPWADPWFAEMVDEKPLPWSARMEKKVVSEGDWITTYFGVHYGLASIRRTPQRLHLLGHWRRRAERPASMRDVGTLDIRMGFNETRIAEDGEGVISPQGLYRIYQEGGRLLLLARPNLSYLADKTAIRSLQCTAALFNYEEPQPTWELYVDDQRIERLPASARFGQVITIRDGVTYLAIRPIPPSADPGRNAEILLEPGTPQEPLRHTGVRIQPALLVHAFLYRAEADLSASALEGLSNALVGMAVEFGDEASHGTFDLFRKAVKASRLAWADGRVVFEPAAGERWVADWETFTINGTDPLAALEARHLWQDTSLSQLGRGRLEKNGAVVEREELGEPLLLQTFPRQKRYVVMNLLPMWQTFAFREPGGVSLEADGRLSMGQWSVTESRNLDIRYHPFERWHGRIGDWGAEDARGADAEEPRLHQAPPPDQRAQSLFIRGIQGTPNVTLNGRDVTARLERVIREGAEAWRLPLDSSAH